LNALLSNDLADQSILYIYSDAPREGLEGEKQKVEEVRRLIRSKKWCKDVQIIESLENRGLAVSIISGVTEVVNKHGKIIVLEDDIVTSKGFLRYMNEALNMYENEERVYHISGYMFPVKGNLPKTFFYKQTSCWGWATWKKKWNVFESSADILFQKLKFSGRENEADIDGTNQFVKQLKANVHGTLKSWAVLWHFSVFFKNGLSLHPYRSLVQNIGLDNSGVNCGVTDKFNVDVIESLKFKKIGIKEHESVYNYLHDFYDGGMTDVKFLTRLKTHIKASVPEKLKKSIKIFLNNDQKEKEQETERLRILNLPRFTPTELPFLQQKIRIVDIASFNFIQKEIFEQEIYRFESNKEHPYIIDCGANIGLSVIYFKRLFPGAEIIAFEPDTKVFEALEYNTKVFELTNVELVKKACWNEETTLTFFSEGADGGRVAQDFDKQNNIQVPTVRLRDYLYEQVDFLKMDIEGAEVEVLDDVKDLLVNVEKIFVEFHSFEGKRQKLSGILSILEEAGFRYNIHHIGVYSPNPFIAVSGYANMDLQLNIYGYRL
jgi:FkbM family methyltransferase